MSTDETGPAGSVPGRLEREAVGNGTSPPAGAAPGSGSPVIPYRFPDTTPLGEIVERFGALDPGVSTGVEVRVAGRVLAHRPQGRLAFSTLADWTGSLQLFAGAGFTEDFGELVRSRVGDWIGAEGEVVTTKRGELSIRVAWWSLLARAARGFGDKWHGVQDPDARYRHREVDLWANEGPRAALLARSRVVSTLRRHLEGRGFVEVETPILHPLPGGATARPFVTHHNALRSDLYLRIAPELYLKRLVVGGFERVFELGRVFRNEGLSPRHNPEFTMLECYQAYADYRDMMELVEQLVAAAAVAVVGGTALSYQGRSLDLTPPWRRATMAELVGEAHGCTIHLEDRPELESLARGAGIPVRGEWGSGKLLLELYEKTVEGTLWDPVHVCDYPAEVSPLARPHRSEPGLVERFESIVAGRELVNAFSELGDPEIQRRNFEAQAAARAAGDDEAMLVDEDYLFALEHGLPPAGGLGLGVDRLVMLLTDTANIREVIAFPTLRPLGP